MRSYVVEETREPERTVISNHYIVHCVGPDFSALPLHLHLRTSTKFVILDLSSHVKTTDTQLLVHLTHI